MDVERNDARNSNENKTSSVVVSNDGMDEGKEDHGETRSLLLPSLRSGSKKVQWNNYNEDKLVEVVEFQPRGEEEEEASPTGAKEVAKLLDTPFLQTRILLLPSQEKLPRLADGMIGMPLNVDLIFDEWATLSRTRLVSS